MKKTIEKKILPVFFKEVISGRKTFELRKDEDDIQPGDTLILKEWDGNKYTGCELTTMVSYVLRNCSEYGLLEGYCIIGITSIMYEMHFYAINAVIEELKEFLCPSNAARCTPDCPMFYSVADEKVFGKAEYLCKLEQMKEKLL